VSGLRLLGTTPYKRDSQFILWLSFRVGDFDVAKVSTIFLGLLGSSVIFASSLTLVLSGFIATSEAKGFPRIKLPEGGEYLKASNNLMNLNWQIYVGNS